MNNKEMTGAIVDGVIKFVANGGLLTTALIAPNAVKIFDKPLLNLLRTLDERERQRELRRVLHYMKNRGLISYNPNDYEYGIRLTAAGRKRLQKSNFDDISLQTPVSWDGRWRLVFFDIPEKYKSKRRALSLKLNVLGYKRLQYSIWIHPFPSRTEIEFIAEYLGVSKYLSYVEVIGIDSEQLLKKRFRHLLKS